MGPRDFLRNLPFFSKRAKASGRLAEVDDGRFIFELCIRQAQRGHFNLDVRNLAEQAALRDQISYAIGDAPIPMPGRRNNAGARVLVLLADGVPAGFAFLLEDEAGTWASRVELYMVALDDAYKGHGLGTVLVRMALSMLPETTTVVARCLPASRRMAQILGREGFRVISVSANSAVTLELLR